MGKVGLIVFREFWTRVRKRSFILTTLLAPLGFALFFIAIIFMGSYSGESRQRIVVLDETGFFQRNIADGRGLYFFFEDSSFEELKNTYLQKGYDAILYIPQIERIGDHLNVSYYAEKQPGIRTLDYITHRIRERYRDVKIEDTNIDRELLAEIQNVSVNVRPNVLSEAGAKEVNTIVATAIGYFMGFAIYIVLFIYGTMVMKGVMEEKTNRIVEIMASSVKPFQLMLGKIIGIGMVGITQFLLWGILIVFIQFFIGIFFGAQIQSISDAASQEAIQDASSMGISESAPDILESLRQIPFLKIGITFIFYFFGGYLLYGAMFAAIGSATNDDGDLQSLTFPISIPIIISMVIMMSVVDSPDSPLAVWSSIIPLSSPIIMPARIAFGVPVWQLILSISFLIAGFILTTWIAGKIYRTGILMYGKKVTVKELLRWMWYK